MLTNLIKFLSKICALGCLIPFAIIIFIINQKCNMEKFKTVNNAICKQIVFQCAENFNHRILTRMLFNAIDVLSDKIWLRMFNLCVDCGFFTCTEHFVDYVGVFSQELISMHKVIISHLNTILYAQKKNK